MKTSRLLAILAALFLLAAACSSTDDGADTADDGSAETTEAAAEDEPTEDEPAEDEPTEDAEEATEEAPEATDADDAADAPAGDVEPLRIASITALTGPLAVFGEALQTTVEFAVEEVNEAGGVLGMPVELVLLESDGTPDAAVRTVERAVQDEGTPYITSIITTPETLALAPELEALDAVFLSVTSKSQEILQQCNPRVFEFVQTNPQSVGALGSVLGEVEATEYAAIVIDQATGVDMYASFQESVEAAGLSVQDPIYVPPGTADYAQQIGDLQSSGADGLYVVLFGGDGITFSQQAEQFGLFDSFSTVLSTNFASEPLFAAMGPVVTGVYSNVGYHSSLDNPANEAFVGAWQEAFGDTPFYVEADQYLALQMLFAAVEEAGTTDPTTVAETLSNLSMDSIVGPVEFRPDDNRLLRPEYIGQVVEADTESGLGWEIVTTAEADDAVPPVSCV